MSLEILRLKKVSKISVIVVRVLQLVLVINLIAAVYGIVAHKQNAAFENANIEMLPGYASVVMQVLLVLVLFPIAELLKSLYNGYTPFDMDKCETAEIHIIYAWVNRFFAVCYGCCVSAFFVHRYNWRRAG